MRAVEPTPLSVRGVFVRALARAGQERAPEAAASIGFFAVFSFLPLLLIIVAVGSTVLSSWQTQEQLLAAVLRFVPVSREFVSRNLLAVLRARGAVGSIGAVALLWAATSAISVFLRNLSRAWPGSRVRSALGARLMALVLVGALVVIVALFVGGKTATAVAHNWGWLSDGLVDLANVFRFIWRATIIAVLFLGLAVLYRWVPAVRVRWGGAMLGAGISAGAFVAVTAGFTWYLESRFAAYNIVYGSLGALVALLSWVYMLALIALFGGHVAAAAAAWRPEGPSGKENT